MKYVYLCGGYGAPEGGVYEATVAPVQYKAEHPDYICLKFPCFPNQPMITCHSDVVFDSRKDAILLAIQNIDKKIQYKLEELKAKQHILQNLIKARVRFLEDYAEASDKETTNETNYNP